MNFDTSKLCILTGNANPKLAEEVAQYKIGRAHV